ncbi:protein tyrosine phosphatase [Legionella nagasakiensis]|uniref:protein tyrosine phosphatase n=1 Tax=Legionella nagasakiensis TaxID=535290 RepID=UPI001055B1FC|nr:protein tyrosine phosphatase [Legionella nagasakiensis]
MGWIFVCFLLSLQPVFADKHPVRVGDEIVIIHQKERGRGKTFVHLHQNETTALKAANAIINAEGGHLLTLIHSGERNIVFHLYHKRYEFDPNRIFSDIGIKKTLMQFGSYTPEAHQEVKKLADKIKMLLPEGKIIAVHNNRSYSVHEYLPGHPLSSEAQALNYSDKRHYRNFYLVTKKDDFIRLKDLNYNSVWQARNAEDDGSLSIYLASRDYVNVEAGYDQLTTQIKMLKHA